MKSQEHGKHILSSKAEVSHISMHGIWVFVIDTEYFLPFELYPWFKDAKISAVHNVELIHNHHLHWPDLDVDLDLNSFDNPEEYPLKAKS